MYKLFSFFVILAVTQATDLPTKTVKDYQKQILKLQAIEKSLYDEKFYEDNVEFKEKKTNKIKKFSEFSKIDRYMFQMMAIETYNKYLKSQEDSWQEELKKAIGKVQDSHGDENTIAGSDDITKSIAELANLRKQALQNWENHANIIFKEFPKEFTEAEKNLYLKKIKSGK